MLCKRNASENINIESYEPYVNEAVFVDDGFDAYMHY